MRCAIDALSHVPSGIVRLPIRTPECSLPFMTTPFPARGACGASTSSNGEILRVMWYLSAFTCLYDFVAVWLWKTGWLGRRSDVTGWDDRAEKSG